MVLLPFSNFRIEYGDWAFYHLIQAHFVFVSLLYFFFMQKSLFTASFDRLTDWLGTAQNRDVDIIKKKPHTRPHVRTQSALFYNAKKLWSKRYIDYAIRWACAQRECKLWIRYGGECKLWGSICVHHKILINDKGDQINSEYIMFWLQTFLLLILLSMMNCVVHQVLKILLKITLVISMCVIFFTVATIQSVHSDIFNHERYEKAILPWVQHFF